MRDFLIEMFEINLQSNLKMTTFIKDLPEPAEPIKLLSHLVNCQYKWLDRIRIFPEVSKLDWWEPVYDVQGLKEHFSESTNQWIQFLSEKTEEDIEEVIQYFGYDGTVWESRLRDIALQLTFHSYHHRAQIQMMIRAQGVNPKFIDYIAFKQKKAGAT